MSDLAKVLDPAFEGAGEKTGTEIWRIENFQPVPLPKSDYGTFYPGDSYIVLQTSAGRGGAYLHDIHFWIGKDTSLDEAGTAAIKTLELDAGLGGKGVKHRELQGHESYKFLSYFKPCIIPLEGGFASGFQKAVKEEFETRLYMCKGKRAVKMKQVPFNRSSLNHSDVFILDTEDTIYQFNGAASNIQERAKALELIQFIKDTYHDGKCDAAIVDDGTLEDSGEFWLYFGGFAPIAEKSANDDDDAVPEATLAKLYSIANGKLDPLEGELSNGMLENNKCYLLDCGDELYVWFGQATHLEAKKSACHVAEDLLTSQNRPKAIRITWVSQGYESHSFKFHFNSWSLPDAEEGREKPTAFLEQQDGSAMSVMSGAPLNEKVPPLLTAGGRVEVWRIDGSAKISVPKEDIGQFHRGDCYIVLYTYRSRKKENYYLCWWIGKDSVKEDQKVAAQLANTMSNTLNGRPVQGRIFQGNEPPQFLALFKPMILLKGGLSSGYKKFFGKAMDDDDYTNNGVTLFRISGTSMRNGRAVQVNLMAASLDSNECYVLRTETSIFTWHGRKTSFDKQKLAVKAAETLKPGSTVKHTKEGSESSTFWAALGVKQNCASEEEFQNIVRHPHLYSFSVKRGKFQVEEIYNFTQDDLLTEDVMILDTHAEVFVWVGQLADPEEQEKAFEMGEKYVAVATSLEGMSPHVPLYRISEADEPCFFTTYFSWDPAKSSVQGDSFQKKFTILFSDICAAEVPDQLDESDQEGCTPTASGGSEGLQSDDDFAAISVSRTVGKNTEAPDTVSVQGSPSPSPPQSIPAAPPVEDDKFLLEAAEKSETSPEGMNDYSESTTNSDNEELKSKVSVEKTSLEQASQLEGEREAKKSQTDLISGVIDEYSATKSDDEESKLKLSMENTPFVQDRQGPSPPQSSSAARCQVECETKLSGVVVKSQGSPECRENDSNCKAESDNEKDLLMAPAVDEPTKARMSSDDEGMGRPAELEALSSDRDHNKLDASSIQGTRSPSPPESSPTVSEVTRQCQADPNGVTDDKGIIVESNDTSQLEDPAEEKTSTLEALSLALDADKNLNQYDAYPEQASKSPCPETSPMAHCAVECESQSSVVAGEFQASPNFAKSDKGSAAKVSDEEYKLKVPIEDSGKEDSSEAVTLQALAGDAQSGAIGPSSLGASWSPSPTDSIPTVEYEHRSSKIDGYQEDPKVEVHEESQIESYNEESKPKVNVGEKASATSTLGGYEGSPKDAALLENSSELAEEKTLEAVDAPSVQASRSPSPLKSISTGNFSTEGENQSSQVDEESQAGLKGVASDEESNSNDLDGENFDVSRTSSDDEKSYTEYENQSAEVVMEYQDNPDGVADDEKSKKFKSKDEESKYLVLVEKERDVTGTSCGNLESQSAGTLEAPSSEVIEDEKMTKCGVSYACASQSPSHLESSPAETENKSPKATEEYKEDLKSVADDDEGETEANCQESGVPVKKELVAAGMRSDNQGSQEALPSEEGNRSSEVDVESQADLKPVSDEKENETEHDSEESKVDALVKEKPVARVSSGNQGSQRASALEALSSSLTERKKSDTLDASSICTSWSPPSPQVKPCARCDEELENQPFKMDEESQTNPEDVMDDGESRAKNKDKESYSKVLEEEKPVAARVSSGKQESHRDLAFAELSSEPAEARTLETPGTSSMQANRSASPPPSPLAGPKGLLDDKESKRETSDEESRLKVSVGKKPVDRISRGGSQRAAALAALSSAFLGGKNSHMLDALSLQKSRSPSPPQNNLAGSKCVENEKESTSTRNHDESKPKVSEKKKPTDVTKSDDVQISQRAIALAAFSSSLTAEEQSGTVDASSARPSRDPSPSKSFHAGPKAMENGNESTSGRNDNESKSESTEGTPADVTKSDDVQVSQRSIALAAFSSSLTAEDKSGTVDASSIRSNQNPSPSQSFHADGKNLSSGIAAKFRAYQKGEADSKGSTTKSNDEESKSEVSAEKKPAAVKIWGNALGSQRAAAVATLSSAFAAEKKTETVDIPAVHTGQSPSPPHGNPTGDEKPSPMIAEASRAGLRSAADSTLSTEESADQESKSMVSIEKKPATASMPNSIEESQRASRSPSPSQGSDAALTEGTTPSCKVVEEYQSSPEGATVEKEDTTKGNDKEAKSTNLVEEKPAGAVQVAGSTGGSRRAAALAALFEEKASGTADASSVGVTRSPSPSPINPVATVESENQPSKAVQQTQEVLAGSSMVLKQTEEASKGVSLGIAEKFQKFQKGSSKLVQPAQEAPRVTTAGIAAKFQQADKGSSVTTPVEGEEASTGANSGIAEKFQKFQRGSSKLVQQAQEGPKGTAAEIAAKFQQVDQGSSVTAPVESEEASKGASSGVAEKSQKFQRGSSKLVQQSQEGPKGKAAEIAAKFQQVDQGSSVTAPVESEEASKGASSGVAEKSQKFQRGSSKLVQQSQEGPKGKAAEIAAKFQQIGKGSSMTSPVESEEASRGASSGVAEKFQKFQRGSSKLVQQAQEGPKGTAAEIAAKFQQVDQGSSVTAPVESEEASIGVSSGVAEKFQKFQRGPSKLVQQAQEGPKGTAAEIAAKFQQVDQGSSVTAPVESEEASKGASSGVAEKFQKFQRGPSKLVQRAQEGPKGTAAEIAAKFQQVDQGSSVTAPVESEESLKGASSGVAGKFQKFQRGPSKLVQQAQEGPKGTAAEIAAKFQQVDQGSSATAPVESEEASKSTSSGVAEKFQKFQRGSSNLVQQAQEGPRGTAAEIAAKFQQVDQGSSVTAPVESEEASKVASSGVAEKFQKFQRGPSKLVQQAQEGPKGTAAEMAAKFQQVDKGSSTMLKQSQEVPNEPSKVFKQTQEVPKVASSEVSEKIQQAQKGSSNAVKQPQEVPKGMASVVAGKFQQGSSKAAKQSQEVPKGAASEIAEKFQQAQKGSSKAAKQSQEVPKNAASGIAEKFLQAQEGSSKVAKQSQEAPKGASSVIAGKFQQGSSKVVKQSQEVPMGASEIAEKFQQAQKGSSKAAKQSQEAPKGSSKVVKPSQEVSKGATSGVAGKFLQGSSKVVKQSQGAPKGSSTEVAEKSQKAQKGFVKVVNQTQEAPNAFAKVAKQSQEAPKGGSSQVTKKSQGAPKGGTVIKENTTVSNKEKSEPKVPTKVENVQSTSTSGQVKAKSDTPATAADPKCKEPGDLSKEEIENLFGMTKKEFDMLPRWKQDLKMKKLDTQKETTSEASQGTFTYEQLKSNSAAGVDSKRKEAYLSDGEFQTLFTMTKKEFYDLPQWKQDLKKKKLDLF